MEHKEQKNNSLAEICILFPKLSLDNQQTVLASAQSLAFAQENRPETSGGANKNFKVHM